MSLSLNRKEQDQLNHPCRNRLKTFKATILKLFKSLATYQLFVVDIRSSTNTAKKLNYFYYKPLIG